MFKVILIDDEPKAVKSLKWEIENYCQDVEILETFTDPFKAVKFLKLHDIDGVFLDIEMPDMTGFDFLDCFQKRRFKVVFVTAYSQYAIKAIKENAMDYLLKPIDTEDLIATVEKLKAEQKKQNYDALERRRFEDDNKRIKIPVEGKLVFLETDNIIYCEGDGNYSRIYLEKGKPLFVSKILKQIQTILPSKNFFRVHNSYIINIDKVSEYLKTDGYVILDNHAKIPVSRNRKSIFLDKIE